jgi:hypothetical protein
MGTKVDVSDAPWQACECGGRIFESALMAKRLSALMSPDGQEHSIPIELYVCKSCGKIPGFIVASIPNLPEDLKAVKPLI